MVANTPPAEGNGTTWPAGGKVDVDDGSGNWITVFDSGPGTALGLTADGTHRIPFAPHLTRHVRLTGYFDPNAAQGVLVNIEVFCVRSGRSIRESSAGSPGVSCPFDVLM